MNMRSFFLASAVSAALVTPVMAQMGTPATSSTQVMSSDHFYTEAWAPTHWRVSEYMGLAVYNRAGERIGEIDDVLFDSSGKLMAAVVGVGGFLGMGERKVAVTFRSFEMTRETNGNPRLVVDLNKETLKTAPEYKYMASMKR
jgi:hypothetical protein